MPDPETGGNVPIGWVAGIVGSLAAAVALLWRASRSDSTSIIAAMTTENERLSEQIRRYEDARDKKMEVDIRQAVAMERVAEQQKEVAERLDRVERFLFKERT